LSEAAFTLGVDGLNAVKMLRLVGHVSSPWHGESLRLSPRREHGVQAGG